MYILGIDTSVIGARVEVTNRDINLACSIPEEGEAPSAILLSLIMKTLHKASISLEMIDIIAIAEGPGSFTGLRVGFGAALGLGDALDRPVVGVGTMDALARSLSGWSGGYILPILNSRKGEVYCAMYTSENGQIEKLTADMALAPEALARMVDRPAKFVGDGFSPYSNLFRSKIKEDIEIVEVDGCASVLNVCRIAYELSRSGEIKEMASPRYASKSQAEINWEKENI